MEILERERSKRWSRRDILVPDLRYISISSNCCVLTFSYVATLPCRSVLKIFHGSKTSSFWRKTWFSRRYLSAPYSANIDRISIRSKVLQSWELELFEYSADFFGRDHPTLLPGAAVTLNRKWQKIARLRIEYFGGDSVGAHPRFVADSKVHR